MDNDSILTLQDENGNDIKFEFLDLIEYDGEEYVILFPVDDPEADEVVILRLDDSEDDLDSESYVSVDDDSILDAIFNLFRERNKELFDFIDD